MSLKQLGKLETLAEKRADQSRLSLSQETAQLHKIEHHCDELSSISNEYQQGVVGLDEVPPQLLAQRRAFVEQLTDRLEALEVQRKEKQKSVRQKSLEHTKRTAQHTAIEILRDQRAEQDAARLSHREQQMLDEAARYLHHDQNSTTGNQTNE